MARIKYGQPGIYNATDLSLADEDGSALATNSKGQLIVAGVASGATDSGNPVKVGGVYNSTPPTLTTGQRGDLQLDENGNTKGTLATGLSHLYDSIITYNNASTTGVVTTPASSASNGTLLAANASRLGATIYNDSTSILYLKLGATASPTSFTVQLVPNAYYEVPFGYTGIIDGIWAAANGYARVTELT